MTCDRTRTRTFVLATILLLASCGGLKINPPGPSTPALLIIPVELDAKVVSVRHSFYYIYEITKSDDPSFSYDVEIKFPVEGDMLIIDSLSPGDYQVRKFTFLPVGTADTTYGTNSFAIDDRFSLESGKITIFSKSLKLVLRNEHPGRFDAIKYNFDMIPVTSNQEKAIQATLKNLPNYDKWEALGMEQLVQVPEGPPLDQEAITKTLGVQPKSVKSVVFSSGGETVFSTDGGNLILAWDVSSGLPVFGGARLKGGQTLAFSPNGKVAVARNRNILMVVDLVDRRVSSDFEVSLESATFSPAYAYLSSESTKALLVDGYGNVSLWDLVEGRVLFPFLTKAYGGGFNEGRDASAYSPAGSVVLVASSLSPKLKILDVKSGNILRTIIAHEQGTRASAFSSDGTEIATVGMDNSFKLWNVESGKLLNTYDTSAVFVINRVAFSSYGKLLITGHDEGSMTIWSAETGSILKQFKAHDGWVETIAVSSDGRGLASGGPYGKVKYWNLAKILAE